MPQLVVVVLTENQICDAVVRTWAEIGVYGATIFESAGLRQILHDQAPRDDLPLMPSLRAILGSGEVKQRTLFTVVPDDFDLEALMARTEAQVGNFEAPNTGILFVVPVTRALGLKRAAPPLS